MEGEKVDLPKGISDKCLGFEFRSLKKTTIMLPYKTTIMLPYKDIWRSYGFPKKQLHKNPKNLL